MSNPILSKGLKNFRYSFLAQGVILIVGVLKTMLVPTLLSVQAYAYWQMYLFYISYIGFFYLGYNDGIMLKYGKYEYGELPFEKLRSSMTFYMMMLIAFSILVFGMSFGVNDIQKSFVVRIIAFSIVIYGLNGVFIYVFLITNQIKRHSLFTAIDSASVLVGAAWMLLAKDNSFVFLVYFVFFVKLISVTIMTYMCKDFFLGPKASLSIGFFEFIDNIKFGGILMLAQVMGMLLTGLGRIIIEYTASIEDYAYYSFGLTIISVLMVAVTAISTVMYPTLARVQVERLPSYLKTISTYIRHFNALALLAYFPAYIFVDILFPKYVSMLPYLAVFFVMFTWQAKTSILLNSFFRVLRLENQMLKVNVIGVAFFTIITVLALQVSTNLFDNRIMIIAITTCITMCFIEIVSEFGLRKAVGLTFDRNLMYDIAINICFLTMSACTNIWLGFAGYFIFIIVYFIFNLKNIIVDLKQLRSGK